MSCQASIYSWCVKYWMWVNKEQIAAYRMWGANKTISNVTAPRPATIRKSNITTRLSSRRMLQSCSLCAEQLMSKLKCSVKRGWTLHRERNHGIVVPAARWSYDVLSVSSLLLVYLTWYKSNVEKSNPTVSLWERRYNPFRETHQLFRLLQIYDITN